MEGKLTQIALLSKPDQTEAKKAQQELDMAGKRRELSDLESYVREL
jgi:hypothetical protein